MFRMTVLKNLYTICYSHKYYYNTMRTVTLGVAPFITVLKEAWLVMRSMQKEMLYEHRFEDLCEVLSSALFLFLWFLATMITFLGKLFLLGTFKSNCFNHPSQGNSTNWIWSIRLRMDSVFCLFAIVGARVHVRVCVCMRANVCFGCFVCMYVCVKLSLQTEVELSLMTVI